MTISEAILATLRYSDYFGFPLKQDEIFSRLINVTTSQISLKRQVGQMKANGLIAYTNGFYHLPGRKNLVSRRLRMEKKSHELLHQARKLAVVVANCPGVLAVYLTGSLAVKNSGHAGDIDFMVITHPGLLWTTRFILTIYTTILGLRRLPKSKHISGKLCLNLYLTPGSYLIPSGRRNLYTAYELIQAVPLYDPEDTRSQLLAANKWLSDYLPNFPLPKTFSLKREYCKTGLLENLLYYLQFAYMKNKITREHITRDSAYFHPHNPGSSVLKKLSL